VRKVCWEKEAEGRIREFGLSFMFGGQRYDEILILWEGCVSAKIVQLIFVGAAREVGVQHGFWETM